MPKLTRPKELVLSINGYDIPVRVLPEGRVEYDTALVIKWLVNPDEWACDEHDVLAAVSQLGIPNTPFLAASQIRDLYRTLLDDAGYSAAKEWFCDTLAPAAKRLAKKARAGSRIVKLNGLLVRQHQYSPWLYSLTDAYKAARCYFKEDEYRNYRPVHWRKSAGARRLIAQLVDEKGDKFSPLISDHGRGASTWACKELLYAYTEYLHPKLHLQILQVFDDYEALSVAQQADVRRAKVTKNGVVQNGQWHEHRAASKSEFAAFDAMNRRHSLSTPNLTNRIYEGLYGTNKAGVAERFKVPSEPLRDHLPVDELEKHTTSMSMVRRAVAHGKILSTNKQEAYAYATVAGMLTRQAFDTFDNMTPDEVVKYAASKHTRG